VVVSDSTGQTSQLAQCVSYWLPPIVNGNYTVKAGATYSAFVTVQNAGTNVWTAASKYDLASVNPFNNPTWGPGLTRVYLTSSDAIARGQQKTFQFTITAPTALGSDYFQWQMIQEGVALFGDTCGPSAPVYVVSSGSTAGDDDQPITEEGVSASDEQPPELTSVGARDAPDHAIESPTPAQSETGPAPGGDAEPPPESPPEADSPPPPDRQSTPRTEPGRH